MISETDLERFENHVLGDSEQQEAAQDDQEVTFFLDLTKNEEVASMSPAAEGNQAQQGNSTSAWYGALLLHALMVSMFNSDGE
jgi:hypothetical protein